MDSIPRTKSRMAMKGFRSENHILHYLRKLVTGTLGNIGVEYNTENKWGRFFDVQYNDHLEKESDGKSFHKCWYRKDNVMESFYKGYLASENVPKKFWGSKQQLVQSLQSKGLPHGKRTDRSWKGPGHQVECFLLSRASIKALHRRWLNDPQWEYPEDA